MYYFIPKRAERPVYSYRLSIIHFWALIFLYIWPSAPPALHGAARLGADAGHDLLDHAVDALLGRHDQRLMTLSGAWDKLRTDPVLRMMVVSVAFYGMSTFEGPLMSIKAVNSLSHYTDWNDRPRAFRRARLGRLRILRRDLLPRSLAVEEERLYSSSS